VTYRQRIGADARRELIAEAALRLFAERGYHGVSLDEVASEAGVTKPVVYDHAISKADLYSGLLERQHDELLAHVVQELDDSGPLEDRIRSALDTFFTWAREHPFAWRLLFGDDTTGDRDVAAVHRALQERANRAVAHRVLGGTEGLAAAPRRAEMLGQILGGATRSLVRWWDDHPEVPKDDLVETIMDVVWRGLENSAS
jgi:AcrR family transcriptional regulator